jgi:hypothetical protein
MSHIVCPTSLASEAGWRIEISGRLSAPFCWSAAARAKKNAATRARIEGIGAA